MPAEGVVGPLLDRLADLFHQRVVEVEVVLDAQPHPEHLVHAEEVPQVATGKIPALKPMI